MDINEFRTYITRFSLYNIGIVINVILGNNKTGIDDIYIPSLT